MNGERYVMSAMAREQFESALHTVRRDEVTKEAELRDWSDLEVTTKSPGWAVLEGHLKLTLEACQRVLETESNVSVIRIAQGTAQALRDLIGLPGRCPSEIASLTSDLKQIAEEARSLVHD